MKASLLVAAAALSMVTTTAPSLADDDGRGCSNASLRGRYGLATHGDFVGVYGTETPPVIHFYTGPSGDRAPVRVDEVTAETFDGHGNATQLEYVFLSGSDVTNGFVGPATGTYDPHSGHQNPHTVPSSSALRKCTGGRGLLKGLRCCHPIVRGRRTPITDGRTTEGDTTERLKMKRVKKHIN